MLHALFGKATTFPDTFQHPYARRNKRWIYLTLRCGRASLAVSVQTRPPCVFRPSPHPHLRDDVLIGSTSGRYFSDVHSQFPHGRLYLNSVQQISRFVAKIGPTTLARG
jgi:hypothetical protein